MYYQNGRVFNDLAAKSGAPQTRAEVDAMIVSASVTDIMIFVKRWLILDDERTQLQHQANHVEHVLGDRLLGILLSERLADISATMKRRALDLARLTAHQAEDIGAKCYVRARMCDLAADDSALLKRLCESIRKDVDALGIDVKRLDRSSN
ncbi:hypothetical protein [Henriciella sp.]|uniref:hypothetical protein n=1 Tax=Henriciella sp. TaxID=1968823 RepID=UPI002611AC04|nr:hypothetical protein [Henriciella sp.]